MTLPWVFNNCTARSLYFLIVQCWCLQKDSLKHLRPGSHHVQYRIALGKQGGQTRHHNSSPRTERPPDLENLLSSLYGQQETPPNTRRRNKKSNK